MSKNWLYDSKIDVNGLDWLMCDKRWRGRGGEGETEGNVEEEIKNKLKIKFD